MKSVGSTRPPKINDEVKSVATLSRSDDLPEDEKKQPILRNLLDTDSKAVKSSYFAREVKGSRVSYKRSNEGDPIVSGVEMPMVAFSPSEEPVNEKPTAAQAAAGRLQRASARQAAKAAQQQRRHAHARLAADHINTTFKRSAEQAVSAEEVVVDDLGVDDGYSEDDAVPRRKHARRVNEDENTKFTTVKDEKERKRLKRLLRNRVSAQQARERKKAYMSTLEDERRNMETRLAEMESRVNTLERENFMLRQVVKSATQGKGCSPVTVGFGCAGADEPRAVPS